MRSIFSTFKGLHKNGAPLDLLATWRKTFDTASERAVSYTHLTLPTICSV